MARPNNQSPDTTTLPRHTVWCSTVFWAQSMLISLNSWPDHGNISRYMHGRRCFNELAVYELIQITKHYLLVGFWHHSFRWLFNIWVHAYKISPSISRLKMSKTTIRYSTQMTTFSNVFTRNGWKFFVDFSYMYTYFLSSKDSFCPRRPSQEVVWIGAR